MCQRLFFNKVARPDVCKLIRRDSGTVVYLSILRNLLRTPFLQNASCRMLLFLLVCRSVFRTFSNILRNSSRIKTVTHFRKKPLIIEIWQNPGYANGMAQLQHPRGVLKSCYFRKFQKKSIKNICGGVCRHKATAYFKKSPPKTFHWQFSKISETVLY